MIQSLVSRLKPQLTLTQLRDLRATRLSRRIVSNGPVDAGDIRRKKVMLFAAAAAGAGLSLLTARKLMVRSVEMPAEATNTTEASGSVLVPDLPEAATYVIVGGGTASFSAVRSIRANDPKSKVIVLSESQHLPYMKPPLSKELWFTPPEVAQTLSFRQFDGKDRSLTFEKPEFYFPLKTLMERETGGVTVIRGQRVHRIDPETQTIFFENGQSLNYEKCLIATGGEPQTHPLFESASAAVREKVTDYRNIDHFLKLQSKLPAIKSILVYGGGLLGTELAASIAIRSKDSDLQVIQVCPEAGLLWKILPQYLSKWIGKKITAEGVKVLTQTDLQSVSVKDDRLVVQLDNGSEVVVDQAIVTTRSNIIDGFNKELAEASGLELHPTLGGFVTNAELMARSNLWVAGDAACFYDCKFGRRRVEQHDQAVASGRVAGENMTGGRKAMKQQAMFWSDLTKDLGFEAVGLIDSNLETVAVFAQQAIGGTDQQETAPQSDYERGVVFYLKDKKIVGILMMNVFNRVRMARRILKDERTMDDLSDVAKWFNIYSLEE